MAFQVRALQRLSNLMLFVRGTDSSVPSFVLNLRFGACDYNISVHAFRRAAAAS